MHRDIERDDEIERPRKTKRKAPAVPKEPVIKQSYESNADVQRWLVDQAIEASSKPEFNPTLLSGRRDRDWILSSLTHFYEQDLITDVLHAAKSGKEASVYCCAADPATGLSLLAAKVYRPRMFRSLSNDAVYRESRQQHDERGRVVRDGRRQRDGKHSQRGRAQRISSWIEYEFQTQRLMHQAGCDVPQVLAQVGNAVLMEFIGDADTPAPRLHEVALRREEAYPLWERLLRNVELSLSCHRIHGDLSAYNILYWQGKLWIIDFAQAVDPRHNHDVVALLERDIDRIYRYFARYGVRADPAALAAEMWARYLCGDL
jgi:RIO kinase 1